VAKRITLTISGMECPNCAMKLESIEDRLAGVLQAEASYQRGTMKLVYDEVEVDEAQIQSEIQRLGFEVTAIRSET
jgi:Zn2+/Cd2+-exporting ATPase